MRFFLVWITLSLVPVGSSGQQLQEILQEHYQAAGQEKMGKVETMITQGKNRNAEAGISSSFTLYQARPVKIRIESEFRGSLIIQTYNGEKGWMIAPKLGITDARELSATELKPVLNQADFEDPLWNYQDRGSRIELVDTPEDSPSYHLRMTTSSGEQLHFFIDRKSFLISSIRSSQVIGGNQTEITSVLQDYKSVRGIPVARKIQTRMNGETVTTIEIERVDFNKKIDPLLFEKPAVETEEEAKEAEQKIRE